MDVLSLFDGMACGLVALKRAGIPVSNYYASEIDKYAIQIAKKNHPEIHHIGPVERVRGRLYRGVDLLIGGSPCQGFSFAGKQLNFDDPRSALFFEYVRVLKECRPKWFLLENVRMKQEYQEVISEALGVKPILINSALVSAQNRQRLYWTNIPGVEQPEDRGLVLADVIDGDGIIHTNFSKSKTRHYEKSCALRAGASANYQVVFKDKSQTIPATIWKENPKSMLKRGKMGLLVQVQNAKDKLMEDPRVKGITETESSIRPHRGDKRKSGLSEYGTIVKPDADKAFSVIATHPPKIVSEIAIDDGHLWRKLTPLECERLQTLPDDYTGGVSNTQRYRMIGNGWTVDVISHIFAPIAATAHS